MGNLNKKMSIEEKEKQVEELLKRWWGSNGKTKHQHFRIEHTWCSSGSCMEWSIKYDGSCDGRTDGDWKYYTTSYPQALFVLVWQLGRMTGEKKDELA